MILYWDFDGTLVHSGPLWSTCLFRALQAVVPNSTLTLSDVRSHMVPGFPWETPEQDSTKLVGERWWAYMNAHFFRSYLTLGLDPSQAQTASRLVRALLLEPGNYILYPDCHETLAACVDRGYHNVLLSNNHPDLAHLMDALGLAKYFEHFIISGEVGYDKPRAEIFALANAYGPPGETRVMIGDSLTADIWGGNAAGMKTVLVHTPPSAEADICISSLSALLPTFDSEKIKEKIYGTVCG